MELGKCYFLFEKQAIVLGRIAFCAFDAVGMAFVATCVAAAFVITKQEI
jgi:hypothetical protein